MSPPARRNRDPSRPVLSWQRQGSNRTAGLDLALTYSPNTAVMVFPCRDSGIYGIAKPYSLAEIGRLLERTNQVASSTVLFADHAQARRVRCRRLLQGDDSIRVVGE